MSQDDKQRELLAEALEALDAMLVSHSNLYRQVFGDPARGIEADPDADIIRREAIAAADKIRAALEHQQKGEGL